MAGLGRRTHYRKHLTDSVLYDLPEPKADECIAKVVATRGGNQFDVILPEVTSSDIEGSKRSGLAILPTKFHKLVWVKRNDYVIVQTGIDTKQQNDQNQDGKNGVEEQKEDQERNIVVPSTNHDPNQTGIRFIISHILYKDQVKHLISKGLWPENDPEFSEKGRSITGPSTEESNDGKNNDGAIVSTYNEEDYCDDGIVYNEFDMDNDDDLFVNTNRIARLEIQDSDDEEASSDEEN